MANISIERMMAALIVAIWLWFIIDTWRDRGHHSLSDRICLALFWGLLKAIISMVLFAFFAALVAKVAGVY